MHINFLLDLLSDFLWSHPDFFQVLKMCNRNCFHYWCKMQKRILFCLLTTLLTLLKPQIPPSFQGMSIFIWKILSGLIFLAVSIPRTFTLVALQHLSLLKLLHPRNFNLQYPLASSHFSPHLIFKFLGTWFLHCLAVCQLSLDLISVADPTLSQLTSISNPSTWAALYHRG